jgi:hypothetical protein
VNPDRRPWKLAVALKTLTELLRRYGHLRLIELHPCGGGYDCLGVCDSEMDVLCQFNLAGTSLLIKPERSPVTMPEGLETDLWRYPEVWLEHDLAAQLARRTGLPERPYRPASPPTVALGVIAEMVGRLAMSDVDVQLRSGWHDSSGMEGSFLRDWCPPEPTGSTDWKTQARWGCRFWSAGWEATKPGLVFDLSTGALLDGSLSTWTAYRAGEGIRAMAATLEKRWRAVGAGT